MNEFQIIEKFFYYQTVNRSDVILGMGDDCAIVEVPQNQHLVVTTDTFIAGVHFPLNTNSYDIGYKSLAVNLSDLAAMGATPVWFTMALTLPEVNENWLTEFSHGVFDLAKKYNMQLIGGDLTHGPLSITIEANGFVPKNHAIKRSTATPGDSIFISNTLGDAALGLLISQNKLIVPENFEKYLLNRLNRPDPRVELGESLRGIASAAIDISDGLAADLSHILEKSHVGAVIYIDELPLSTAVSQSVTKNQAIDLALNGGDDYELCFTVPTEKEHLLSNHLKCIGKIVNTPGLDLRLKDESSYNGKIAGYKHF